jgi:hypothetical protein
MSGKPTKRNLAVRSILIIFGIVLSTYALAILVPQGQQQQQIEAQQKEAQLNTVEGTLYNPYQVDLTKDFVIALGKTQVITSSQNLANGFDLIQHTISINDKRVPVQIKFIDNRISVSANVTNADGDLVGWIIENDWRSDSSDSLSIYDRNFSPYAFEIVDRNKVPLLQVEMVGSNKIYVGGLIYVDKGQSILFEKSGWVINPSQEELDQFKTQTLFLYPSKDHLGELVNPVSFATAKSDNSIPLSAWMINGGFALAVVGIIIFTFVGADSYWEFFYKRRS